MRAEHVERSGGEVTVTAAADAERAVAAIVLAFAADPIARWSLPDPQQYLRDFPPIVRAFGGRAFALGTAYHVGDFLGAALWLPPGTGPDGDTLAAIVARSGTAARRAEAGALFEAMGRHHPVEPHWYLPLIGVDPVHRGGGHGGALLERALARCDRDRLPAYLESTSPASIPLYERHGFAVVTTLQVGSSPPLFPMRREAR